MKMSFLFLSVIISLQVAANENLVNNLPLKPTPSSVDIGEYGYTPMPGPDGRYVGIVLFESVDKEGNYIGDKKVPGRGKMLLHQINGVRSCPLPPFGFCGFSPK